MPGEVGRPALQADERAVGGGSWWSRRWRIVLVACVAVLLAIACRRMQFTPDSIHYVDVARTLIEEHTAATWHLTLNSRRVPDPSLYWPPGYPLALALPMALGASPYLAAWLVAVLAWSAVLLLLVLCVDHAEWGLLAAVAFLYLIFICGVAFRAWSEGLYSALMVGALVCMALAIDEEDTWRATLLGLAAGGLAGGAALCRYPGVVIVIAMGLAALVVPLKRENAWELRWSAIVPMIGSSGLMLGAWLVRNQYLTGRLLGPERPPSERSVASLVRHLSASFYLDFGGVLLALLFAVVGFHVLRSGGEERRRHGPDFFRTIALAALLCAIGQIAVTMLTHALWQVDEPPNRRYFFPGYLCALVAGLAVIARATPPAGALRRRWPVALLLGLPIVLGPIVAIHVATDVTPDYTPVEAWVSRNTAENDLIIGHRAWPVRFYTGRPVLQSGQAADPSVYNAPLVAGFLREFGDRFGDVYLLATDWALEQEPSVPEIYSRVGLPLEEVASFRTPGYYAAKEFVMHVYRVPKQ